MLELEGVGFTYKGSSRAALEGIDLRLSPGEVLGLTGANGAGKSSLCLLIAGFIPRIYDGFLDGRYRLGSGDAWNSSLTEITDRVGLVFQDPYRQLSGARFTVAGEIAFGLENRGVGREEMHRKVRAVMEELDLASLAERNPFHLSGGQTQRVALAGILAMRPEVLVLDEPTSQLDPAGRQGFAAIIRRYAKRGGSVVLAEQNLEVLAEASDRMALLAEGRIVRLGSVSRVAVDDDLKGLGVQPLRYTQAARAARKRGVWPSDRPLPVRLEDAAQGFRLGEK